MPRILGDLLVGTGRELMVIEGWKLFSRLSGVNRVQLDFSGDIVNLFWNAQDSILGRKDCSWVVAMVALG